MIQVIGIKRFIILVIMILANLGLGASTYLYLLPTQETTEGEVRALQGSIRVTQADIERMQIAFEQLDRQQEEFNKLKSRGFFSNQVRSNARKLFSEIQEEAKVFSAVASVKSGTTVDDPEAKKANHKLLYSPIEIEIEAMEDEAIYRYLKILKRRFPGNLFLNDVVIERSRDVTPAVLRSIASDGNVSLIKAEVNLTWRTMIPESDVIDSNQLRAGGQ
ncbi:MAG: hypothetical protein GC137_05190 [Alphaproteobacteria bacterium]|nr:hypothetical protein [Alphaproteobacteria bacterium]